MYNDLQGEKKKIEQDLNFMLTVKSELSQRTTAPQHEKYSSISEALANTQSKVIMSTMSRGELGDQELKRRIVDAFSELSETVWNNFVKIKGDDRQTSSDHYRT